MSKKEEAILVWRDPKADVLNSGFFWNEKNNIYILKTSSFQRNVRIVKEEPIL